MLHALKSDRLLKIGICVTLGKGFGTVLVVDGTVTEGVGKGIVGKDIRKKGKW